MKHREKVKLARKLRTLSEIRLGVPIFQSETWEKRKEAIQERVKRQQERAHKRALARKKKKI
jgi:hypothetical protein